MAVSLGGFPVLEQGSAQLKSARIPGTADDPIWLTMRSDVLPLFLALAHDYDLTVAPLRKGECGAYAYRSSAISDQWSDHAAGVAVDLNWNHEGAAGLTGGMATMSRKQIKACAALKKKYRIVIWGGDKARGGDYATPAFWDPMHYALREGVTFAQVRATISALGIQPDGTVQKSKWTRILAPKTGVYERKDEHSPRLATRLAGGSLEYVDVERDSQGRKWLKTRAGHWVLADRTFARWGK
jgi:hypothetical protein